jgi:hypothetical protein
VCYKFSSFLFKIPAAVDEAVRCLVSFGTDAFWGLYYLKPVEVDVDDV